MLGEGLRAGLQYMGAETRVCCYVEREAYPASVLAARMEEGSLDPAPVWPDLLTFDGAAWRGAVDGIVAGFPCQDLSLAGRRAGLDGKRSGLFFNILDIADDCGARFLFLENVSGIASATASVVDEAEGALEERAAARVMGELAERGWNAEWLTLSASDVGASHGRERWFCFAWRPMVDAECAERGPLGFAGSGSQQGHDSGRTETHRGAGKPVEILGITERARWPQAGSRHIEHAGCESESGCEQMGHARLQHQHLQQWPDGAEHQGAGCELADTECCGQPASGELWSRRGKRVLLSRDFVLEEAAVACEHREEKASRVDVQATCRLCARDIRAMKGQHAGS